MLGGRVKTLHPKVHGGILADRSNPSHLADLEAQQDRAHRPGRVQPLPVLLGPLDRADRRRRPHHGAGRGQEPRPRGRRRRPGRLRRRARRAARGGLAVGATPAGAWPAPPSPTPRPTTPPSCSGSTPAGPGGDPTLLPPTLHLALERAEELRYGENPHQRGRPLPRPEPADVVGRRRPARRHRAVVSQPLRRRRGVAARARARHRRRARRRHHQARQPVRRRARPHAGRGLPARARVRPAVGLRRHRRPGRAVHASRWPGPWPRAPRPT